MVHAYVHLIFADWRKEEFETGESVTIQERPSSLWGSPRDDGGGGGWLTGSSQGQRSPHRRETLA